jgi:hypothetical protein
VIADREFLLVVVGIAIRTQVDVALRALQRAVELFRSSGSGLPTIEAAIMKVASTILRKPSCSAR